MLPRATPIIPNGARMFSHLSRVMAEVLEPTVQKGGPVILNKNEKVVLWKIFAKCNKHNTICSLVSIVEDLDFMKNNEHLVYNDKVLYYMNLPHKTQFTVSAGMLGFRKAQRQEYEAGYQVSTRLFKMIEDQKLIGSSDKVEVVISNFGKGRAAFESCLVGKEGARIKNNIVRITDATTLKFGGVRSKAQRRL